MKVLTVNYPKQTEDENKIKFLMDYYNQTLLPKVLGNPKALKL